MLGLVIECCTQNLERDVPIRCEDLGLWKAYLNRDVRCWVRVGQGWLLI